MSFSKTDLIWAGLFYIGVGGIERIRKIETMEGGVEKTWKNLKKGIFNQELKTVFSIKKLASLTKKASNFSLKKLASDLERNKINLISFDSDNFPEKLKNIPNPPLVLYCLGSPAKLKKLAVSDFGLAVVGSRKFSNYGQTAIENIMEIIKYHNFCLISGLAIGIDSLAHKKSLEIKKSNIAVLAGGLDKIYPRVNYPLAKKIMEHEGVIVSEFPPGTDYFKQNFPARNRIISGLCDCLLIIEAGYKSGALITADFAIKQGRRVVGLPGSIFSPLSHGANILLKNGASMIANEQEIELEIFGSEITGNHLEIENSLVKSDFNPIQLKIINLLEKIPSVGISEIVKTTDTATAIICSQITQLELEGWVKKVGDRIYLNRRATRE